MSDPYSKAEVDSKLDTLRQEIRGDIAQVELRLSKDLSTVDLKVEKLTTQVQTWGLVLGLFVPVVTMVVNHLWR